MSCKGRKKGCAGAAFNVIIFMVAWPLILMFAIIKFIWKSVTKFSVNTRAEEQESKMWEMQKNFAVIDQMDGHEFEWFVAKVLAKIGFQNVRVTRASGDYGVDIIAYDNGVKCAFQCKRYTGTLGLKPIQEVSAGARYYGASVAYVITNSHFSANAANLANRLGVKLWDRNSLNYLINRINEIERKEREEKDETGISNRT